MSAGSMLENPIESPGDPLRITTSLTLFIAAFYVAAQALERFVEFTFSRFVFRHDTNRINELRYATIKKPMPMTGGTV